MSALRDGVTLAMGPEELERELAGQFPETPLDVRVTRAEADGIEAILRTEPLHLRPGGVVSGPTLMTMADTAMYLLLLSRVGRSLHAFTTQLNIHFLRRAAPGEIRTVAKPLRIARRAAVGEVWLFAADSDEPVAHATVTYAILSA